MIKLIVILLSKYSLSVYQTVRYTYHGISSVWCIHNIVHTMLCGRTVSTATCSLLIVPLTMILNSLYSTLPFDQISLYEIAYHPITRLRICSKLYLVNPLVKISALCFFVSMRSISISGPIIDLNQ